MIRLKIEVRSIDRSWHVVIKQEQKLLYLHRRVYFLTACCECHQDKCFFIHSSNPHLAELSVALYIFYRPEGIDP